MHAVTRALAATDAAVELDDIAAGDGLLFVRNGVGIAGRGIANPTAQILAACMMLEHIDQPETAARIRRAVEATLHEGKTLTPDLGGSATTMEYAEAVVRALR